MTEHKVNVEIFDTTLRDGAQSLPAKNQFPDGTKTEIAHHIAALGISVIEAGFPRTEGDREEVESVARIVGNTTFQTQKWRDGRITSNDTFSPVVAGLCRTTFEDIEVTWDAIKAARKPRIHTFISTDPEHMAKKFPGKDPEEVLFMGKQAVGFAKALTKDNPNATVEFSAEAASTTNLKYLERVIKTAINEGADVINVPDTVGQRDPFWMYKFYSTVIKWVKETNPNITISAHNHNDLGNAVSNSIGLVHAAADYASENSADVSMQIESTICGLGERAGNADVFPCMGNMFKTQEERLSSPIEWQFNPGMSVNAANTILSFADIKVHRQNPIVGSDILIHRSGIHSDGVIKGGHRIYTPFDPSFWGHFENARHEDGKYQGTNGRSATTI